MKRRFLILLLIFSLLPIPIRVQAQSPPKLVVATIIDDGVLAFKKGENTVREFTVAFENVELGFNENEFNNKDRLADAEFIKVKEVHPVGYVHPLWETQMQGVNIAPLDQTRFVTFSVTGTDEFLNRFDEQGDQYDYKFYYGAIVGLDDPSSNMIYDLNRDGVDDIVWESAWGLPVNGVLDITIIPGDDPLLPPAVQNTPTISMYEDFDKFLPAWVPYEFDFTLKFKHINFTPELKVGVDVSDQFVDFYPDNVSTVKQVHEPGKKPDGSVENEADVRYVTFTLSGVVTDTGIYPFSREMHNRYFVLPAHVNAQTLPITHNSQIRGDLAPQIITWIKGLDILGYKNQELGEFLFGVLLKPTPGGMLPGSLPDMDDLNYDGSGDDYLRNVNVGDDVTSWITSADPLKPIPNGIKFRIEDVKKNMFVVRAHGVPESVTDSLHLQISIPAANNTIGRNLDVYVWAAHHLTLEVREKQVPPPVVPPVKPPVNPVPQPKPTPPVTPDVTDEPDEPVVYEEPKKEVPKVEVPKVEVPKKEYSLLRGKIVENIKDNIVDKLSQKYKDMYERDKGKYSEHTYLIGYPDGTFKLENVISKQELAEVLSRILTGFKRGDLEHLNKFSDKIPTWSSASVASLMELGLYNFVGNEFNAHDLVDWEYFNKLSDEIFRVLK